MDFIRKLFGASPFRLLVEHTKKVHDCVLLIRPITEALLAEDHEKRIGARATTSRLDLSAGGVDRAMGDA